MGQCPTVKEISLLLDCSIHKASPLLTSIDQFKEKEE